MAYPVHVLCTSYDVLLLDCNRVTFLFYLSPFIHIIASPSVVSRSSVLIIEPGVLDKKFLTYDSREVQNGQEILSRAPQTSRNLIKLG